LTWLIKSLISIMTLMPIRPHLKFTGIDSLSQSMKKNSAHKRKNRIHLPHKRMKMLALLARMLPRLKLKKLTGKSIRPLKMLRNISR